MAKDANYDLDVLLELRKREREEAEAEYAEALSDYHQAGQTLQACELKYQRLVDARRRKCREFDEKIARQSATMSKIQTFDRHVEGLRGREEKVLTEVARAQDRQRRAQQNMRKSHDKMLAAIKGLKAVEKHRENWQKDQDAKNQRRQSATMDDVAARMWREQQR